jgi:hypothetical protein
MSQEMPQASFLIIHTHTHTHTHIHSHTDALILISIYIYIYGREYQIMGHPDPGPP